MKKLLFTLLVVAPVLAYSQDPPASDSKTKNKTRQYSCRELEVTPDGKVMTLRTDVKIETEDMVLRADSAVFNKESQTWLAYGTKEINFNGPVVAEVHPDHTIRCNNTIIRHKLGENVIYIE